MANLILWNTMNQPDLITQTMRPAGPHILAQWLINFGITVKVIDYCSSMSTEDLTQITAKHVDSSTVAVGVSTTFWEDTSLTWARNMPTGQSSVFSKSPVKVTPEWVSNGRLIIEHDFPQLDWLLGGANANIELTEKWIRFYDYAEDQLLAYMDEKMSVKKIRVPYNIKTSTNLYMDGLGITPHEVIGLEWGRGCQFKCRFCRHRNLGKKKNTYLRDYYLVKQDMLGNYEKYGTTKYLYLDDTTNESLEKLTQMASIAQSLPFQLEWVGYGRLDLIGSNRPTIKLLSDSGLRSMFFGIESFNKEAAKTVGKAWNGVHAKNFILELKDIWGAETNFHLNFIAGISPETPDEVSATVDWCVDNHIPSWLVTPLGISTVSMDNDSEFDRNYSQYGYRFPAAELLPTHWESDLWTLHTAVAKCAELIKISRKHQRPAGFPLVALTTFTGIPMKELIALDRAAAMAIRLAETQQKINYINDYVKFQLAL
jgi:hypothetical protein